MYKLAIIHKGKVVDNIRLTEGTVTIGRKPDCNIHLAEKMVSGKHAEMVIKASGATLKDLDSTNGTSVNGKTISTANLQTGDQISIGDYKLVFVREHGETEDPDATMIISTPQSNHAIEEDKPDTPSSATGLIIGFVVVSVVIAAIAIYMII